MSEMLGREGGGSKAEGSDAPQVRCLDRVRGVRRLMSAHLRLLVEVCCCRRSLRWEGARLWRAS